MQADTIRPITDHLPWAAGYAGDALRCARRAMFEHGDEAELVAAIAHLEQAKRALERMKKRRAKPEVAARVEGEA